MRGNMTFWLGWTVAMVFGVLLALAALGKTRRDRWRADLAAAYAAHNDAAVAKLASRFGREEERLWRRLLTARAATEEAALEETRARRELEDVLASLQDAVLVVDGEARLRFLNAAALRLFDLRIEDVLGANLIEALPSFGLESAMRAALREGQSSEHELQLYSPRLRQIFLRVAPVFSGAGARTGAVAIVQDLTELRRLERVRRDFVANASHELRTPIATIRALAETLEAAGNDEDARSRFLPPIIVEAERLSRLVSDLLDLARAEDAPTSPLAPIPLRSLVAGAVERLRDKAARNSVEIEWTPDGAEPNVRGDGAALEQVAFNLLDNALSYTPRGGRVAISLRQDEASEAAIIEVADNGIGIPEDDLPRVFERFYRVDKARSRAEGGTGLGLAIVKHIVENHRGHVEVESSAGNGTTFRVQLPLSNEREG